MTCVCAWVNFYIFQKNKISLMGKKNVLLIYQPAMRLQQENGASHKNYPSLSRTWLSLRHSMWTKLAISTLSSLYISFFNMRFLSNGAYPFLPCDTWCGSQFKFSECKHVSGETGSSYNDEDKCTPGLVLSIMSIWVQPHFLKKSCK